MTESLMPLGIALMAVAALAVLAVLTSYSPDDDYDGDDFWGDDDDL